MTAPAPVGGLWLAHHALVSALPVVIPMVVLVLAFAAIVGADRRRARRERAEATGRVPVEPAERDGAA